MQTQIQNSFVCTKQYDTVGVTVKKLFHGCASIRSNVFEKLLIKKQSLLISFNNQTCLIPYVDLERLSKHLTKKIYRSRYDPLQVYYLVDIPFYPTQTKIIQDQYSLFQIQSEEVK